MLSVTGQLDRSVHRLRTSIALLLVATFALALGAPESYWHSHRAARTRVTRTPRAVGAHGATLSHDELLSAATQLAVSGFPGHAVTIEPDFALQESVAVATEQATPALEAQPHAPRGPPASV